MSRTPHVDPSCAATVLALIDAARVHAPDAPLAWLAGYAARAAGERVQPREAPGPVGKVGASGPAIAETERALRASLPPDTWEGSS